MNLTPDMNICEPESEIKCQKPKQQLNERKSKEHKILKK